MVELKYSGKQISLMTDAEIRTGVTEAIKRIHVITGWNIPDDAFYMKILAEELHAKLKESFDMLNFREIVAAFRTNGIGVKDWGKNMNLDLVCNVLWVYCDQRARVSLEEERIIIQEQAEQKIYTEEQITNERRGHIEASYQCMRCGRVPVMHIYFPEVLYMDGLIPEATEESMTGMFVKYLGEGKENIYVKEK